MSLAETSTPKRTGRETLYREEYAEQVYELALLGLTDAELADAFNVDERTVNNWKRAHPRFFQSILRGRVIADGKVARGLYERSTGYSHPAVKIFPPRGEDEEPLIVPYVEHYPPDTAAASLWLRNRQPKKWRDARDIQVEGKLTLLQLVLASMGEISVEELEAEVGAIEGPAKTA